MEEIKDYKVVAAEEKTASTGKKYKSFTLADDARKISIWPDNPEYSKVVLGGSIRGKVVQKGDWYNFVAENALRGSQGATSGFKQKVIEETMQKKEASITKFQGAKEEGIKVASTLRMAVDLSVAEITSNKEDDEASLQARIKRWRSWLWAEWEKPVTGEVLPHVPEEPPFN